MPTEAQIAANRLNAQKSTGPRTPEGKAIASQNSIKHSALWRNLFISSPANEESSAEFQALCDDYYAEFKPVGHVEELLVKQIIKAVWCMGRAEQAELAEIALSLKAVTNDNDGENNQNVESTDHGSGHVERVLQFASLNTEMDITDMLAAKDAGREYLLNILRQARQTCERDQGITREMFETTFKPFGNSLKSLTDPLTRMMEESAAHFKKPDASENLKKLGRDALAFFDEKIRQYEQLKAGRRPQVDPDLQSRQKAALLPAPHILYKILRYESAQERQFFRALHQLQKLQSRRRPAEQPQSDFDAKDHKK
jgi:hypothetical protein